MKKYSFKTLVCAACIMFLSLGLSANADCEYGIVELAPNSYAINARAINVIGGFNLESSPGSLLSVFRVSLKFPTGSTTTLNASVGGAPFGSLAATGPNTDATGEYFSYSFSGGTLPVPLPSTGVWVTLFTFTTVGADVPVLWMPGDPMTIGPIGTDNLYLALAPQNLSTSEPAGNNFFNNAVVPVELTTFDVIKRNGTEGLVIWETASEQNTAHFEVERSRDGKSWSHIGTVKAEGFTEITQYYSFVDESASQNASFDGNVFYRLRIMDYDGYQEYTTVKKINFRQHTSKISAFPNPASALTNVNGIAGDAAFRLISKEGKVVKSGIFTSGTNELRLDDLPAGVYVISIDMGVASTQIPIVKTN